MAGEGPRQHCFAYDPTHVWERTGEFNENAEKSFIEGAWMTKHQGRYYLQYSAPGTEWKCYAVGCYTSDLPAGPWTYQQRNPVLIAPRGSFVNGCGHHSIVEGPNGGLWCFYTTLVRIEHAFERRIGMDPAGFDAEGNFFVAGPTDTPQLAPGVATDPLSKNGAGLQPVSVNLFAVASSHLTGHEPSQAIDNEIRTWWEAAPDDREPWLEIDLGREWSLSASRILFADRGLSYSKEIVPGPYRYIIKVSHDRHSWDSLWDKRSNEIEQHIVYDSWPTQRGRWVRLRITGAPPGMRIGVWEWTVFGS